jgi:hypothetical protein
MNSEIPICHQCPLKNNCASGVDPVVSSIGLYEPEEVICNFEKTPHARDLAEGTKTITLNALKSPSVISTKTQVKYATGGGPKIQTLALTQRTITGQKWPPVGLTNPDREKNVTRLPIYINSAGTRFVQGKQGYYYEIPYKSPVNYNCARCQHWVPLKDPELIKTALNKIQRYRDGILTLTEKISIDLANLKDFLTRKNKRSGFLEDLSTINPSQISSGEHSDEDHQALMYYLLRGNEPIGICRLKQEAFKTHPLSPIFTPGNLYCTKTEINGTMQFEPKEP